MEKASDELECAPELNGLIETALFVEVGAYPTPVIDTCLLTLEDPP